MTLTSHSIDFTLAESSIAKAPAERRGTGRDDIRLMVTHRNSGSIVDDGFGRIDDHLEPGDVIVVNTSATVPASVVARTAGGDELRVHIASPAPGGLWSVELRSPFEGGGTVPGPVLEPQTLRLPGGVALHLLARSPRAPRLWIADVEGTPDMDAYLELQGGPIRYTSGRRWPMADYQTIFATEPGSAEMPSAARPFTHQLMTRLVARGVVAVPIVLHAGVSSYEEGEAPGEERYRVPATTATIVNALRSAGGRVVAVGTTVVRALESVVDDNGVVHPGRGLTDLVVTPDRGVRAVDGLLTGWHEPRSSHLTLLEAFLPHAHLQVVYDKALTGGYLWHEFGDELLILP